MSARSAQPLFTEKQTEWFTLGLAAGAFPIMALYGVAFAIFGDRSDINHVIAHLRLVFGSISGVNLVLGVAAEIWAIRKGRHLTKAIRGQYREKKYICAAVCSLLLGTSVALPLYSWGLDIFFVRKLFWRPYIYFAFLCLGANFLIISGSTYLVELARIRMENIDD